MMSQQYTTSLSPLTGQQENVHLPGSNVALSSGIIGLAAAIPVPYIV